MPIAVVMMINRMGRYWSEEEWWDKEELRGKELVQGAIWEMGQRAIRKGLVQGG